MDFTPFIVIVLKNEKCKMEPKRENTIKLRFGSHTRNPSNDEVFAFFKEQAWSCDDLSAMYREDFSLFIRFQSEARMKNALIKLGPHVEFKYANGDKVQVSVSLANGTFRYVRIFGLPPEVKDEQIAGVLAKYGTIHQMVRERYAVETGFPIWNGIRGVHMEVVSEIPAQLHIQSIRARVYYEGLQHKCFVCGALDHLKAACPKRQSVNARLAVSTEPASAGELGAAGTSKEKGSFASVVVKGLSAQPGPLPGMVVLSKHGGEPEKPSGTSSLENVAMPVESSTGDTPSKAAVAVQNVEENGAKKRSREVKRLDSESSESDAISRKQIIVPSDDSNLLVAQTRRSRSLTNKKKNNREK